MISPDENRHGKEIPNDRKKLLYHVYKKYGNINEHKLNELLHSDGSPLCMDQNPYMLQYIMMHNITFKDSKLEKWYRDFLLEFEENEE